jgi:hypothetical protein
MKISVNEIPYYNIDSDLPEWKAQDVFKEIFEAGHKHGYIQGRDDWRHTPTDISNYKIEWIENSFNDAAEKLDKLLSDNGITEDELLEDFKKLRDKK